MAWLYVRRMRGPPELSASASISGPASSRRDDVVELLERAIADLQHAAAVGAMIDA